jgi:hypothetical protein
MNTGPRWVTVAVTALPSGWRNVYRDKNGAVTTSSCAAILLQEERYIIFGSTGPSSDREDTERYPYATRVVCAAFTGRGLEATVDLTNYIRTMARGEELADWINEE